MSDVQLTTGSGIRGDGDTMSFNRTSPFELTDNSGTDDSFKQFARIDSGFLAWDFWLKDADDRTSLILLY